MPTEKQLYRDLERIDTEKSYAVVSMRELKERAANGSAVTGSDLDKAKNKVIRLSRESQRLKKQIQEKRQYKLSF